MTTETLVAGRELDAVVAEKVMGWQNVGVGIGGFATGLSPQASFYARVSVPLYSTDIAAAWEVVEKMDAHKFEVDRFDGRSETVYTPDGKTFYSQEVHPAVPYYKVNILCQSQEYYGSWHGSALAKADTAPLAICLAALRAVAALQPVEK